MINKCAIALMGLPGAGKGTQAFELTFLYRGSLIHVDTGGEIYRRIMAPAFANDPTVRQQFEVYFAGKLNDPRWVADLVAERIRFYAGQGKGVVFSGSPRTLYEAQTLLPLVEEVYGRGRLLVLEMIIPEEVARQRSLGRLVCGDKLCRYPTTKDKAGRPCPNCGQSLPQEEQKDERWKVEKLGERFREFSEKTLPALEFLRCHTTTTTIDGNESTGKVFAQVLGAVVGTLWPGG